MKNEVALNEQRRKIRSNELNFDYRGAGIGIRARDSCGLSYKLVTPHYRFESCPLYYAIISYIILLFYNLLRDSNPG